MAETETRQGMDASHSQYDQVGLPLVQIRDQDAAHAAGNVPGLEIREMGLAIVGHFASQFARGQVVLADSKQSVSRVGEKILGKLGSNGSARRLRPVKRHQDALNRSLLFPQSEQGLHATQGQIDDFAAGQTAGIPMTGVGRDEKIVEFRKIGKNFNRISGRAPNIEVQSRREACHRQVLAMRRKVLFHPLLLLLFEDEMRRGLARHPKILGPARVEQGHATNSGLSGMRDSHATFDDARPVASPIQVEKYAFQHVNTSFSFLDVPPRAP